MYQSVVRHRAPNLTPVSSPSIEESPVDSPAESRHVFLSVRSVGEEEAKPNGGREAKNFFKIAAFVLLALCTALCVVLIVISLKSDYFRTRPATCMTPDCFEAAGMIGAKINFSADPCEDFYEYSCGGWMSRNEIPDDQVSWGNFDVIVKRTDDRLQQMLEVDVENNDIHEPNNICKTVYRQCMDTEKMDKEGTTMLEEAIARLGGWSYDAARGKSAWTSASWNFDAAIKSVIFDYGASPFFVYYVGDDGKEPTRNRLHISPDGLHLNSPEYYMEPNSTRCVGFRNYTQRLGTLMGLNDTDAEEFMKIIWDFEVKIANITPLPHDPEQRDPTKSYNKFPFADLKSNFTFVKWGDLLDVFTNLEADSDIIMSVKSYFVKLVDLVAATDVKTLNNYVISRVIYKMAPYVTDDFRDALADYNLAVTGAKKPPRKVTCVKFSKSLVGTAVGAMFVKKYFSPESKKNVLELIEDIKAVFKEHVDALDWMDKETKVRAKAKADAIIESIGYPDFVLNDTKLREHYQNWNVTPSDTLLQTLLKYFAFDLDKDNRLLNKTRHRDSWEGNAALVNAYYFRSRNAIVFPAGILQRPFYDLNLPMFFNYAAIGTVIGHELTHAFDDSGAKYDLEGKMNTWWTNDSWVAFKKKTECMVDYYDKYYVNGLQVRGELTQGENIADTGGLGLAYDAYRRRWLRRRKESGAGEEEQLPGVPLDVDQAFFVAYGQVWCQKTRPEAVESGIKTDPHAPGSVRTMAPPSLMPQFQDAFGCRTGSKMAPEKRCVIW